METQLQTLSVKSLRVVYMFLEVKFSAVLTFTLLLVLLNFNPLLSAFLIPHFLLPQALSLLQVI